MRYKPGKTALEYWNEISDLACEKVAEVYKRILEEQDLSNYIFLMGIIDQIEKHVIFEIYYYIYILCAETHSLKHYHKLFFAENINISQEGVYQNILNHYKKYRLYADDIAQYYYNNVSSTEKITNRKSAWALL